MLFSLRKYRVFLLACFFIIVSFFNCELREWDCQSDLDCQKQFHCQKGVCISKKISSDSGSTVNKVENDTFVREFKSEHSLEFETRLDRVNQEPSSSEQIIETTSSEQKQSLVDESSLEKTDHTEKMNNEKPQPSEGIDRGVRMKDLICTNYRRGWTATCIIHGTNFQNGDKGWIGCFLPDTPKIGRRISSTKWEFKGRWACCQGDENIEVKIRGANGNLITSRKLEGRCHCDPPSCLKQGKTCGIWKIGNNYLNCGQCPYLTKCLPSGHCSCHLIHAAKCSPKEKKIYSYDSCGRKHGLKYTCSLSCLEAFPHDNDRCQSSPPKDLCANQGKQGQYCVKSALVICQSGKEITRQQCPYGCIVSPSPGKASCLKAQGKTIRHSSGLCLAVSGGYNIENANVTIENCNKSLAHQWLIKGQEIRNAMGFCLDIAALSLNCSNVQIHRCYGGKAQRWSLTASGQIRNGAGLCLAVYGGLGIDKANVHLYKCQHVSKQSWKVQ